MTDFLKKRDENGVMTFNMHRWKWPCEVKTDVGKKGILKLKKAE